MSVRRSLLVIAAIVGGLAVLIAGIAIWLLHTESGARWALGVAVDATDGALAFDEVSGNLADGVELTELSFDADTVVVRLDDVEAAINVDLVPLGVVVESPRLAGLLINIVVAEPDEADSSSTDLASVLESLALPIELTLTDLEVTDISVSVNNEELVSFDRLGLSAYWHDRIELSALELTSTELAASTDAKLELARPFALSLQAGANVSPALTGLPDPIDVAATLSGDLDRLDLELREEVISMDVAGQVLDVLGDQPRWDLVASGRAVELPIDADVRLEDVLLRTSGWVEDYDFESSLAVVVDERIDVSAKGSGSLSGIDLADITGRHPAGTVKATGRLDFPFDFDGKVAVSGRPGLFLASLPTELILEAGADLRTSARQFEIAGGRIDSGGASVSIEGLVDLEREEMSAKVDWRNLHWPLGVESPDLVSSEGVASVSGRFDDWAAEADAALEPIGLPEGRFLASAVGSGDSAEVDIVEGDILGGSLDGSAAIAWGDAPSWSVNVNAESIETGALVAAFPGSVSATVSARSLGGMNSARVEVSRLEGVLLDEPVAGNGALEVAADRLAAEGLEIVHGESMLKLDGDMHSDEGLRFDIGIREFSDYAPELSGDFVAQGSISNGIDVDGGNLTLPEQIALNMTAGSESLRYGEFVVDGLRLEASRTENTSQAFSVNVVDVRLGERQLGNLDLDLALDPDQQSLALTVRPLGHTVTIGVAGTFDDWSDLGGSPWRGNLDEFTVTTPDDVEARLAESSPIAFSVSSVDIGRSCVSSDVGSSVCAALSWSDSGAIGMSAEAIDLPIAVIDAVLQTGFAFEQRMSGTVSWRHEAQGLPTGGANIRFTGGDIRSDDYPGLDIRTDPGVFAFEVEDGALLSGELDLPLPGTGFLKGSFLLSDVNLGVASPLQGALAAEINDIEVFAALLPDIDDAAGQLKANLTLEGSVAEPVLLGDAALIGATLTYFPLGLKLDEIDLEGTIDATQRIDLNGQFRAGEGLAVVQSSRDSAEDTNPGLHFEIRGDNLTVVDLPDVNAIANADLRLDFRDNRLDLDGRIDIPFARILPRNLAASRVDESDDVVIIEGELPEAPALEEEESDLEVHGKLSLGIGDDVEVLLEVARAELSGNADFEWSGDLIPIGNGRYDLVGTVQAFGQVLNITEGGVRFPNVPADNPNIRIRATREIYGNSQIKRAGILVDGSVERPTVEAYTVPLTTEERALALLLTGNDFDLEQGVGAIDFGTYIAPRLFLSYGVGVFARENIISARYDLARGFGVRVTSGSRDSGADLTYRIER